jgi:hypothetical protein
MYVLLQGSKHCNGTIIGYLVPQLESLKVDELKDFLKVVGEKVSGTKKSLIERVSYYFDSNAGGPA